MKVRPHDELHGDVGVPFGALLAHVVDGDDVGMVQPAGDLRFMIEALQELILLARRKGEREGDRLEGDHPSDAGVSGLVDHPHRSAADFLEDFVAPDRAGLVHQPDPPPGAPTSSEAGTTRISSLERRSTDRFRTSTVTGSGWPIATAVPSSRALRRRPRTWPSI